MKRYFNKRILSAVITSVFFLSAQAGDKLEGSACQGFGPQTPRDIDSPHGENKQVFSLAGSYKKMNLCNIHFHKNAEHKAKAFSIYAGEGEHGVGGGYRCGISNSLSKAELKPTRHPVCKNKKTGSSIKPGDTIEVHWVHSSCQVKPGKGLGSCASEKCLNPELRVETQVFTVVNDKSALNFNDFDYDKTIINGFHQAKSLPTGTGKPIEFLGSTTGPKYSEQKCSEYQVSWSVRPECAKVDISSLQEWCSKDNAFDESYAHGVRKLVTNPKLLSKIK